MEKKHEDLQVSPSSETEKLDRRRAMLKIVRTAAYAVPTATVLLAASKDAKAGQLGSGFNGSNNL